MKKYNCIGWTRSGNGKGDVDRYHLKDVANTITSFSGGVLAKIQSQVCITPHRIY